MLFGKQTPFSVRSIMYRKIRPEDREIYLRLSEEFYHSDAVLHTIPRENHERTFEQLMSNSPYADCYIFEQDNEVAGYALLAFTWSNEGGGIEIWLDEIYILDKFRGKGIGSEFFDYLFSLPGIARIRLEAEPDNEGAIRLYKRNGFKELPYTQFIKGD